MKTKRKLFVIAAVVLGLGTIAWWLSDSPKDVPPSIPETMGPIAFDPKFGPKTPQDVQEYVERRMARNWRGGKMTPADRESPAGKHARAEAIDTLQRRWGFTPAMNQEQIDAARAEREAVWTYYQHTRTFRYKVRGWLGLNK